MSVYTYAEAQQQFARLLDEAKAEHEVLIKSPEGSLFSLQLVKKQQLREALPHLGVNLSREEILAYMSEIRER